MLTTAILQPLSHMVPAKDATLTPIVMRPCRTWPGPPTSRLRTKWTIWFVYDLLHGSWIRWWRINWTDSILIATTVVVATNVITSAFLHASNELTMKSDQVVIFLFALFCPPSPSYRGSAKDKEGSGRLCDFFSFLGATSWKWISASRTRVGTMHHTLSK